MSSSSRALKILIVLAGRLAGEETGSNYELED
jgi:hypothetical protein